MSQLFQNISMEDRRVLRKAPRSANTPADRSKPPATQLSRGADLPALCLALSFCKPAERRDVAYMHSVMYLLAQRMKFRPSSGRIASIHRCVYD